MKLSIVIPLYNKEKFIKRCLESLLAQDISPAEYEIIIVDDGSTDSGGPIARDYAEKHSNIKFFGQKNAGPSAARNRGLEASMGDYIYFLDADDFLAANVLKCILDIAGRNNLEILEFNTKETKDGTIPESIPQNHQDLDIPVMDGITYIAKYGFRNEAWRYIVSNRLLKDTGITFIEGTLYEDVIFTASLFLRAERISKAELDVHRYVTVENSIVTSRDTAHNLKFINGMVYAIERIQDLIKGLNSSHSSYNDVVKKLKARQQAFVFALIIRTIKYRLLNFKDLKKILAKMNTLETYPINPKIGIGNDNPVYNSVFVPIFNNKTFLLLGIRITRLIPFG